MTTTDRTYRPEDYQVELAQYARMLLARNSILPVDDLVQATLARATARIGLYQPTGSFLGWLCTIQKNIFIDTLRRTAFRTAAEEAMSLPELKVEPTQELAVYVRQIAAAIRRLPAPARECLLYRLRDASYEDMVKHFKLPPGTVRSRLNRARTLLRTILGDDPAVDERLPDLGASRRRPARACQLENLRLARVHRQREIQRLEAAAASGPLSRRETLCLDFLREEERRAR